MTKKKDNIAEALANGLAVEELKKRGLFACTLNNGDWMVGRANCIYHLDVRSDHYKDERLSIAPTLLKAIGKWIDANEV